jgi:hypothetical protein
MERPSRFFKHGRKSNLRTWKEIKTYEWFSDLQKSVYFHRKNQHGRKYDLKHYIFPSEKINKQIEKIPYIILANDFQIWEHGPKSRISGYGIQKYSEKHPEGT